MRPAEYVFSRYSTVSGKKSSPAFAERMLTAVTSSMVSPYLIITEPSACFATFPVSTINSRPPTLIDSFKYFFFVICLPKYKDGRSYVVKLRRLWDHIKLCALFFVCGQIAVTFSSRRQILRKNAIV